MLIPCQHYIYCENPNTELSSINFLNINKYLEESRDEEDVWCRRETGMIAVPVIAEVTILMLSAGEGRSFLVKRDKDNPNHSWIFIGLGQCHYQLGLPIFS